MADQGTSESPVVFISPVLIVTICLIGGTVVAAFIGLKMGMEYGLIMIACAPFMALLINRLDWFFIMLVFVGTLGIWLPFLPGQMSLQFYLKSGFVILLAAFWILRGRPHGPSNACKRFVWVFAAVMVATIMFRGTGLRVLGSDVWGGRVYIILGFAIAYFFLLPGAFVLTQKQWMIIFSFLIILPAGRLLADLSYLASGGAFYHLYYIFRPGEAIGTATEALTGGEGVWRVKTASAFDITLLAMLFFPKMVRSFGGKTLFTALITIHLLIVGLTGHRIEVLRIMTIVFVFFFLGWPRWRLKLFAGTAVAAMAVIIFSATVLEYFPAPIQRAFSSVPLAKVEPYIAYKTELSTNWRLDMWKEIVRRELPGHWIIGKGLTFKPTETISRHAIPFIGWYRHSIEQFIVVGNYHNGPLRILVGFGVVGLLAAFGIMYSAIYRHYKANRKSWENSDLKFFHLILLSMLTCDVLLFFFAFGNMTSTFPKILGQITVLEVMLYSGGLVSTISLASKKSTTVKKPVESLAAPSGLPARGR